MLVEAARVEEEVGSLGKVSLSEKVVLVLLAVEAGVVKEGSGFLPSRRVRVSWSRVKGASTSLRAEIPLIHGCCGR